MCCCGEREKGPPERKQRWSYIELNDFRCHSCGPYFAYSWLWFMALVSVAVYAVDTFTAINLLVFDRWSSQVKPEIPFKYSRWIFSGCILFSWTLLIYEWLRAWRIMKRDGVASSYMDPIAMSLQSMRKRGWRRFLVYTELTKSKKGTDYIAFFVYFGFQGAIRVVIAEGPRQFVNAVTLYAVMQAQIINGPRQAGKSNVQQFFLNIGAIADDNYQQAIIYASMLFTFVIWVFSAICLLLAGFLYLVFLWHYIPQEDGRLRIYLRRKIDRRLERIVAERYGVADKEEAERREKAEKRAELKRQRTGELPPTPAVMRAPTLPDLGNESDLKKYEAVSLNRANTQSTVSTLPPYRPPTAQGIDRQPTLPDLSDRPNMPNRTFTSTSAYSNASFESSAPLLPNAGYAGTDGRAPSPAPTYYSRNPSVSSSAHRPIPDRMNTSSTQQSYRPYTPTSATSSRPPPSQRFPVRSNTAFSFDEPRSAASEVSSDDYFGRQAVPPSLRRNAPPPRRQDSDTSYFSRPIATNASPPERTPTFDSMNLNSRGPTPITTRKPRHAKEGSFSRPFAPGYGQEQQTQPGNSYEMTSRPPGISPTSARSYTPFNPSLHYSSPVNEAPRRNITTPVVTNEPQAYSNAPPRNFTSPVETRGRLNYEFEPEDDYSHNRF